MTTTDYRPYLGLLASHLRDRPTDPLPLFLRDWLLTGIARHFQTAEDLPKALGLRLPGRESSSAAHRRDQRNAALRDAARLMDGDIPALARAIKRFESRIWPRWRLHACPPENATEVQRALFEVFLQGPPPSSAKQLQRILGDTNPMVLGSTDAA